MNETKRPLKYDEFIFKLQFQRKIHPSLFLLSKQAQKIVLIVFILQFFFPDVMEYIFGVGFYLLTRKYNDTRLTYKTKLVEYHPSKEDDMLPLISKYLAKKEFYIKNQNKALSHATL